MAYQLAIDTSTAATSLAIGRDSGLVAELTWRSACNQTVELLPRLNTLMEQNCVKNTDLSAVIVATGPGTFNGLRVGLATAKGLALALGTPIVGVGTLAALAHQHAGAGLPVCAVMACGASGYYAAIYKQQAGHFEELTVPHFAIGEEIAAEVNEATLFCGDLNADLRQFLTDRLGDLARFATGGDIRHAGCLLDLGQQRLARGESDNAATLQALYLRPPQITAARPRTVKTERVKAVIWDMDGVIIDSAAYHVSAWRETLSRRGISFSDDYFQRTFGLPNAAIIGGLLGDGATPEEIASIAAEKEERVRGILSSTHLSAMPGVAELMRRLKAADFKQAVASSAPLENIRLILGKLELEACFQAIVSEKDVTRGKPDPQVFLTAARRLEARPQDCVVIEDAISGVEAAKAAGMRCIAVTTSHPAEVLPAADVVVATLLDVNINDIDSLIKTNS